MPDRQRDTNKLRTDGGRNIFGKVPLGYKYAPIEFAPRLTVGHLAVVFFLVVDRGAEGRRRRKTPQPKKKLWVQGFILRR